MASVPAVPPEKPRFHPFVQIFPEMDKAAFDGLVADIRTHGVREPSTVHKNQVVDGRNRELACQELGIVCPRVAYQGNESELLDFVLSKNLHRRHLDQSQRAVVAAKIANMRQGERTDLEPSGKSQKVSRTTAAQLLNVSPESVTMGKKVIVKAVPEVVQAVEQGKLPVSAAAKIAEHPPAVQHDAASKIKAGATGADVVRTLPPKPPPPPKPAKRTKEQKSEQKKAEWVWAELANLEDHFLDEFGKFLGTSTPASSGRLTRASRRTSFGWRRQRVEFLGDQPIAAADQQGLCWTARR